MINSKKIGRVALLKYYLVFVLIILSTPVIVEIISGTWNGLLSAIKNAYKLRSVKSGFIFFVSIQWVVIFLGIWFLGGKLGEAIIERGKSKFKTSFMTIFKMWLLYFISASVFMIISNYSSTQLNFLINAVLTTLYISLIIGISHGLIVGYFLGNEIDSKGKSKRNIRSIKN